MLKIIAAYSNNLCLGIDNNLPFKQNADLKRFKDYTLNHSCIMGRKTYESIGRLLPNRKNCIITNQNIVVDGATIYNNIEDALAENPNSFIIGGGKIYEQCLPLVDELYITVVDCFVEGDTFFPVIDDNYWKLINCEEFKKDEKNEYDYKFLKYVKM